MAPARAVLFDLDGTLLDTLLDLALAVNEVLERAGHPTRPVDAYRHLVGDGIRELVRRALPAGARGPDEVETRLAEMRAAYGRRWRDHTRPYEGATSALAQLRGRGLRLAVLSNKPDDFTHLCVETFLPGTGFEAVVGARADRPLKPDPAAATEIARGLGVPPGRVLYVGDTSTDMRTAVSAGMVPVGALWGFRDAGELLASGARHLVDRPGALLDLPEVPPRPPSG